MKQLQYLVGALVISIACRNPKFTANPDDHTSTSGTAGSAKMTTQLPPKSDNVPVADTVKIKIDSLQKRRDSL